MKVGDCDVCQVFRFKTAERSKLNRKTITLLGLEYQLCVRQMVVTGSRVGVRAITEEK
jgi:hypothetical protein